MINNKKIVLVFLFLSFFGFIFFKKVQAAATLNVTMSVVSTLPVQAGNPIVWQVNWECSSIIDPCLNAAMDVVRPTGVPDASVQPLIAGAAGSQSGGGETPTVSINGNGDIHWQFISPLPPGSSGAVTFTYFTEAWKTPNGEVFSPVATFSASNAASVNSTAPAAVSAELTPVVQKTRLGNPTPEPPLNSEVTYKIHPYVGGAVYTGAPVIGKVQFINPVVVDTLPLGSVFVRAYSNSHTITSAAPSSGGVTPDLEYDALARTVTWRMQSEQFINQTNDGFGAPTKNLFVVVQYPSGTFSADNNVLNTGDNVTNSTTFSVQSYLRPVSSPTTVSSSATHGFTTTVSSSGTFSKNPQIGNITVARLYPYTYSLDFNNTGNVPATFVATDYLPCPVNSPVAPGCTTVGYQVEYFRRPNMIAPITVQYTTTLGHVGTINLTNTLTYYYPGPNDVVPYVFSPGEKIVWFTATSTIPAGGSTELLIAGHATSIFPDDPLIDLDPQTNCASATADFGGGPVSLGNACGGAYIVNDYPYLYITKNIVSGSVISPGGQTEWSVEVSNQGQLDWSPRLFDILPIGLTYVPGSFVFNDQAKVSPSESPIVTVVNNFNGTGKQMLKVEFSPGTKHLKTSGGITFRYKTVAQAGLAPGSYSNALKIMDREYTNLPDRMCAFGVGEADVEDIDGDSNTTELRCDTFKTVTVASSPTLQSEKQVKGSLDTVFLTSPGIGATLSGSGSMYKINLVNAGNVDLKNITVYDIFPYVGDTGVSGSQVATPRNSAWPVSISGPVTTAPGVSVEYSTSTNPCRGEVFSSGAAMPDFPLGCVNNWVSSALDYTLVKALRYTFGATVLPIGANVSMNLPVVVPPGTSGVAWNSIAIAMQRADNNSWLLPTEPAKVGLEANPPIVDLALNKTVSSGPYNIGSTVSYTVTITNTNSLATDNATGVTVKDLLPAELTYGSSSPALGTTYDNVTGIWNIGSLSYGSTKSLTITATINSIGNIINDAYVQTASPSDIDSAPGSPIGGQDDEASVTISATTTPPPAIVSRGGGGGMLQPQAIIRPTDKVSVPPCAPGGKSDISRTCVYPQTGEVKEALISQLHLKSVFSDVSINENSTNLAATELYLRGVINEALLRKPDTIATADAEKYLRVACGNFIFNTDLIVSLAQSCAVGANRADLMNKNILPKGVKDGSRDQFFQTLFRAITVNELRTNRYYDTLSYNIPLLGKKALLAKRTMLSRKDVWVPPLQDGAGFYQDPITGQTVIFGHSASYVKDPKLTARVFHPLLNKYKAGDSFTATIDGKTKKYRVVSMEKVHRDSWQETLAKDQKTKIFIFTCDRVDNTYRQLWKLEEISA